MKVKIGLFLKIISLTLCIVVLSANMWAMKKPGEPELVHQTTKTVDPCSVATSDQLKSVISTGIESYFPLKYSKNGDIITISNPHLMNIVCPNLRTTVFANIQYEKNSGFPQFSTSGDMSFTSPVITRVTYEPGVRPYDIHKASVCLTDINITELNLRDIPSWASNTWIKECLNGELPDWTGCEGLIHEACFDITEFVRLYLQQGGNL